jgi:hypothetical protein
MRNMDGRYIRCSKISSRGMKVDSTTRLPRSQKMAKAVSLSFLNRKRIRPDRQIRAMIASRVAGGVKSPC